MTNKNIEKLSELRELAYEIQRNKPKEMAISFKQSYLAELQKLKFSEVYQDLSATGRAKKEEQLRNEYTKLLFKEVSKLKAEYEKVHNEATTLAKKVQLTEHAAPSDSLAVKLFEKELEKLKTSTMLSGNAKKSMEEIGQFIEKYNDPYYASIIEKNFNQLSQNVLSIESNLQSRQTLTDLFNQVQDKSTTEEQAFARATLANFGDGNVQLFYKGSLQYNGLSDLIGSRVVDHLDNPNEWLSQQESVQ